jgi:purine nucleosidase
MPRPILIDTDPGQDDAVAILLALASPEELSVQAITTVAGNVPGRLTALNARKIAALAGRADIPVFAGCDAPLVRPLVTAEHVHGRTGLDGSDLPEPAQALQAEHAVDAIIRLSRAAAPGTLTICPLGPLTNIAAALIKAPDIAAHWREIVLMGGAYFEVGNITPAAEFNIYVDPEAAARVLACGAAITLLPLDATHRLLVTPARMEAFRALGNAAGQAIADMLSFSESFDLKKYGWGGAPIHDPAVIAWLLAPHLFSGRRINVMVETDSALTRGMTVADYWRVTDRPANALFLREADAEGFFALLTERLARLP